MLKEVRRGVKWRRGPFRQGTAVARSTSNFPSRHDRKCENPRWRFPLWTVQERVRSNGAS